MDFKISEKFIRFLEKYNCIKATDNSAITVAIEAPIEFILFINIKFNIKLITAPQDTDIVNSFCLFVGNKY